MDAHAATSDSAVTQNTAVTPNPVAFEDGVRHYLRGAEEQFNYDALLHTFLDNERFHRWARLIDRHRSLRDADVLSSGCGMGGSLLAYHDAGAASVTGVEVDATYVRLAQLRVAEVPTAEVREIAGDGVLPFDARSFDVIESMDVIEHVEDPLFYLRELRRVLRRDGLILLVTPNRLWPVEQHLDIAGPPWLPIGAADRLFELAAHLPVVDQQRAWRYRRLRGMRTQNMSLLRLRRLAKSLDLHLAVVHHDPEDDDFPFPAPPERASALLRNQIGKFIAPVPSLTVLLRQNP